MAFFSKLLGDSNARFVGSLRPTVERVNALEPEFGRLSDEALQAKTAAFKERIANGETLDELLPEAFAAVREAARRVLGQRHFDVQLLGGIVLHQGKIAEMKTGEGKTLVATLPLYLNALTGKGCHLVTPNDYLSRVGGGWMGPVYHALGVSVGVICHDFSGIYDPAYVEFPSHGDPRLDHWRPVSRREAYAADVTYGTNNEFGFDFLRDNMAYSLGDMVQLRRAKAPGAPDGDAGAAAGGKTAGRTHHFAIVDEVDSILIDEARTPLIISAPDEESASYYQTFARIIPQLTAETDYNVDEKMKAVSITEEGIEKVERLLGVTNIYEEKGFRYVRYLESALRAESLFQRDRDYVVRDGQAVIVDEFTGRLMPGRRWSEGLHQAIEAKEGVEVQRESRTLATVTFQNYFRMYEKIAGMTGTAATSAEEFHKVYGMDVAIIPTNRPLTRRDLPDLVFASEPGKFAAVTREIKRRHEQGQPVLVGTVSIEKNERLSAYLERDGIPHKVLNAKNHEEEAKIIAQAGRRGAVTIATNMAGRGVDILLGGSQIKLPKDLKDMSGEDVERFIEEPPEAEAVKKLGGLFVLGTERHEARRIDNQLRGRAGRQGDPGETQFYLSLEDDLMRVFGSQRIKGMMATLGIAEDQPIENRLVSRSIEAAQSKIEGFHFDARKHILEFDDVMNRQRDYVYRTRREALAEAEGDRPALFQRFEDAITEEVGRIVRFHTASTALDEWNLQEIGEDIRAIADLPQAIPKELERISGQTIGSEAKRGEIARYLTATLKAVFNDRRQAMADGLMAELAKTVTLQSIDMLWMDHLDQMEHLRDSVRLRAYGQRDPLVEYKNEGLKLFRELQAAIRSQTISALFKVIAPQQSAPQSAHLAAIGQPAHLVFQSAKDEQSRGSEIALAGAPVPKKHAVGRNDPCPCGATHPDGRPKKYKHCHGQNV